MAEHAQLHARAGGQCELCASKDGLRAHELAASPGEGSVAQVLVCQSCDEQIQGEQELDPKHWFCLRESGWSECAPVQVLSWRLLHRLTDETWARDLLDQLYLTEENLAWAQATLASNTDDEVITLDSNGARLAEGDSVTLIKDLDVKGGGFAAKRGTLVKNIHLIDDPENIEGRVNSMTLVLKTKFLKKAR